MWSVRILSGAQAGQIYELKLGKNIFGRGGASDLKVQSLGISKEHCEIHVYKDKMMIVDLKSSNGTFMNGVKIQNSIVRVGDKISLFDIIMDIIPATEVRQRPAATSSVFDQESGYSKPIVKKTTNKSKRKLYPSPVAQMGSKSEGSQWPQVSAGNYPTQASLAMQMNYQNQAAPLYQVPPYTPASGEAIASTAVTEQGFSEKIDNFMETKVMPAIYSLANIFSFKQVLQAFVLIFILSVTLMSTLPLASIIKESNMKEAYKRARSVARALAKQNEQTLLSGQLANLTVTEALKEEGIKEAIIVQQSDGLIVAPPEKAGRDESSSIVLAARKESRAIFSEIDSNTIGATFPIASYDPVSGESLPKYHAIVKYDVSSLNYDEGRMVSLFMQTLIIASLFGLLLYQLFARLIEYPIHSLNKQINKALLEKSDRTEVDFDYPAFQTLISNVNTILNRAWSGEGVQNTQQPQQNKEIEMVNLIEIIAHPAVVIGAQKQILALNNHFEQLLQVSRDQLLNQGYQTLTDSSLVQNIESLLARSEQTPFEKQSDRIPFSQFECDINCQIFLDSDNRPAYFVLTLVQVNT